MTGSGKTELYLRLAEDVRKSGRGVLMLVPEIALTPAVAAIFRSTFGDRVAIQHSGLSDGERHDQWQRIRRGDVDVVVGTRSAVFAPLRSVGLIIVDEEHDGSYKQEESPRYHGRDVAVVRGSQAGALVVLGSATPSMESFHNAQNGRYELLTLERRVLDRPLAVGPHRRHARGVCGVGPRRDPERRPVRRPDGPAGAARAVDRAAESPGLCHVRVLPAVRVHAGVSELQRLAHRSQGGQARAMPLLQLFDGAAEGVRQLRGTVPRADRIRHRARRG